MTLVYSLAVVQGFLGATDTFVYHEWLLGLPQQPFARREQLLHAIRDALYAVLYLQLGFFRSTGAMAAAVLALLAGEIGVTLADFLQEDATRKLPGEGYRRAGGWPEECVLDESTLALVERRWREYGIR